MRRGAFDEAELQAQLDRRGFMTRFYGRATRAVRKPWQMYPLGCLFGLGFDTATEVALLVLAGAGAAGGLPFYAILCLPILFAAGMSLFDTLDGAFMNFAYGWAFSRPVRKVFYNLTVTGLSVAVALGVGTVELLSVLAQRLGLSGGRLGRRRRAWTSTSSATRSSASSSLTWAVALAVWRFGHVEERWSARLQEL